MTLKRNNVSNLTYITGLSLLLVAIVTYYNQHLNAAIDGSMLYMMSFNAYINSSNTTNTEPSSKQDITIPTPTPPEIAPIPSTLPPTNHVSKLDKSPSTSISSPINTTAQISATQPVTSTVMISNDFNLSNIETLHIPGANIDRTIYVINVIYLQYDELISIHLLSKNWWNSPDSSFKTIITDWHNYTKTNNVTISCLFPYQSTYLITKVDIVPEVLQSKHKQSTVTLLCNIPSEIQQLHQHHSQSVHDFVLLTSDNLTIIRLKYDIIHKSILPIRTKYNETNSSEPRFLSLCMPGITEPLPFITENIAYHISQGVQHVYLGTYFTVK